MVPIRPRNPIACFGIVFTDVDVALTTREAARMLERLGVNFADLPDEEFDSPLGDDTGAAVIFGATGGVMEAAVRTANAWLNGAEQAIEREMG